MFSRFLLLLTLTSYSLGAKDASLLYNGNDKVMLSLEKQFKVHILSDNKMVASFDLPNATDSQVSGTHAGDDFGLKIGIKNSIKGENGTLDSAELNFGITNDQKSGYWTLTSLKVTFTGTFNGGQIAINGVDLDVHQDKTGLTKSLADKTYERKYAFGAPRNLCWKCDDQIISATASDKNILTARLIMPGVKLQPNLSNSTGSFSFGYEWNCDALIPLSVWVGLLLTLALLYFLYWGIDMLVNLQAPNKFDDPRGKPLSVPISD